MHGYLAAKEKRLTCLISTCDLGTEYRQYEVHGKRKPLYPIDLTEF